MPVALRAGAVRRSNALKPWLVPLVRLFLFLSLERLGRYRYAQERRPYFGARALRIARVILLGGAHATFPVALRPLGSVPLPPLPALKVDDARPVRWRPVRDAWPRQ